MIHPTAIVDKQATLGHQVEIGPFSIVEAGAVLGDRTRLEAHTVVRSGTKIGADTRIDSFSVIGGLPNYLGFDASTPSWVEIGERCVIRESVTVHRSINAYTATTVGNDCFLMAGSHVGHDCTVADRVVFANDSALGGHVDVGPDTFFGGGAMIHQFARIGTGAMVAGLARITRDVAPYLMIGERDEIAGLNLLGLRRRGASAESIRELKTLYQAIIRSTGKPVELASNVEAPSSPEGRKFVEFFIPSKRGYAKNVIA